MTIFMMLLDDLAEFTVDVFDGKGGWDEGKGGWNQASADQGKGGW